jgi:hypothetical protein
MNVHRESSELITTLASISSPDSSTTPVAREPVVLISATGASVRISTPSASAASAIA